VHPKSAVARRTLSNLDASLREAHALGFAALQQRLHITFVYVTHDQAEALCHVGLDRLMNRGRVEQWGTPREIYFHPRTPS